MAAELAVREAEMASGGRVGAYEVGLAAAADGPPHQAGPLPPAVAGAGGGGEMTKVIPSEMTVALAESLRESGNGCFKAKDWASALRCREHHNCLCFLPQTSPSTPCKGGEPRQRGGGGGGTVVPLLGLPGG